MQSSDGKLFLKHFEANKISLMDETNGNFIKTLRIPGKID
jgi:hypothetical protein